VRVVAYTLETSLAVTLSMMDDWEVVAASSIEDVVELAPHASAVLVGMGGTDAGLATATEIYSRGVTIPSVVVGDSPAPEGSLSQVVTRPFSLDDLRGAVERAAGAQGAPVLRAVPDEAPSVNVIDLQQERMIRLEPEDEQPPAAPTPLRPVEADPPAPTPAPEQPRPVQATPAPTPAPPPPAPAPARPAPIPAPAPRRRMRGRRIKEITPVEQESPLVRMMRRVAAVGKDIEDLLNELPMLGDLGSMCQALLGEVVDRFTPEIASVYVRGPKGFASVASHGLSRVEQGMIVPLDHPLFGQMIETPESVLIDPVELAQGLVAGIGGSRTPAMLVAPIQVDGRCVGVLVVGRKTFTDADLDALDDLAVEAAPGLAVAQMLDRLRR
jgi:hypothetical protein